MINSYKYRGNKLYKLEEPCKKMGNCQDCTCKSTTPFSSPNPIFLNNHSLVIIGDKFRLTGVSIFTLGALRCRAGRTGPSRSNWFGLTAFGTGEGAGVIETVGGNCICSTDSGMRGGRSA